GSSLRRCVADAAVWLGQTVILLALLADQAWQMGDAILRTLGRLILRRRLLEWLPAAQASHGIDLKISGFYRRMYGAVLIALGVAIGVAVYRPQSLPLPSAFVAPGARAPLATL